MRRWAAMVVALCLLAGPAWAGVATNHYNRGNRLYEQEKYPEALEAFEAAFDAGADDADLYLNLGNAAFRAGKIGVAVWAYEMGLRLTPRDEDLRFNVKYARAFLRDDLPEVKEAVLVRAASAVAQYFTATEMLTAAALAWAVLGLVAMLWLRLRRRGLLIAAGVAAWLLFLVCGPLAAWHVHDQHARQKAVLVAEEQIVRTAPTAEAPEAFTIHAGLRIEVIEQRPHFARIQVGGGLQGWAPNDSFRLIQR
jgi:tetratricopeptide (TPR) repeat protein